MSELETVAWVQCKKGMVQIPVIVSYEHFDGEPYVYGVFEKADPENDLTTHISDAEHDLIYAKVMTHLNAELIEAAEYLLETGR